jgi:hypothetical protein
MDCRKAQDHFAQWSIEESDLECCEELKQHLQQCPPCAREWERFRQTLFAVSTTTQNLPDIRCSHAMWNACLQQITEKTERERLRGAAPEVSFWRQLFGSQPKWGWAALGGAAVVFGAVWFGAPAQNAPDNSVASTRIVGAPSPFVRFDRPPADATPFINHHTAMGFDPFNDHVGTTMVSDGSTRYNGAPRLPAEEARFQSQRPDDFVPLPSTRTSTQNPEKLPEFRPSAP